VSRQENAANKSDKWHGLNEMVTGVRTGCGQQWWIPSRFACKRL